MMPDDFYRFTLVCLFFMGASYAIPFVQMCVRYYVEFLQ
jgi:hypothetical protein